MPILALPLLVCGLVVLLASAWGGIVPFVGPLFHYGARASHAWVWNYPHLILSLAPGIAGVVAAIFMLGRLPDARYGLRRVSLFTAGLLALLAGAWFIFAPISWSVLYNGTYFQASSALRLLEYEAGYSIGTGLIVAAGGAFAMGWAVCARGGARVLSFAPPSTSARHLRAATEPDVGRVAS